MSIWLNTRGKSTLGIGWCDRCKFKFSLDDLSSDRNTPGLKVCNRCNDQLDPYRLPARQPDDLTLPFYRVQEPLIMPPTECDQQILATETPQGLQADALPGWSPQPGLQIDSRAASEACDRIHNGVYGGILIPLPIEVDINTPLSDVDVSWPLDVGFNVSRFELYAYYDVENPTSLDLQLVDVLGSNVSGYSDVHGYSSNFGYAVVAIGSEGQRASGAFQYVEHP